MTLTRREVLELLGSHGLRPSRALGQNFVVDGNTVRRIARLAKILPGQQVVEVGAGLGALTLELARAGAVVTAVEADRRLVPLLREQVEPYAVRVVEADAMTLDWADLLDPLPSDGWADGRADGRGDGRADGRADGRGDGQCDGRPDEPVPLCAEPWVLVANLPYNVSVPVVMRVLDDAPGIGRMLVMVQREVGERLAAAPRDEAYGAVSVKVAYYATSKVVGRVPPAVFVPKPRVESVLVHIVRRPKVAVDPSVVSSSRLFEVVRAGFAHRRKMLRSALASVVTPEAFVAANIDPRARAEDLSVEDWGRLAA